MLVLDGLDLGRGSRGDAGAARAVRLGQDHAALGDRGLPAGRGRVDLAGRPTRRRRASARAAGAARRRRRVPGRCAVAASHGPRDGRVPAPAARPVPGRRATRGAGDPRWPGHRRACRSASRGAVGRGAAARRARAGDRARRARAAVRRAHRAPRHPASRAAPGAPRPATARRWGRGPVRDPRHDRGARASPTASR